MKKLLVSSIISTFLLLTSFSAYTETKLDITPNSAILGPFVSFTDLQTLESDFEKYPSRFFKTNSRVLPGGLSLVNSLGYQNGKKITGVFPHFSAGSTAGAGVYKLDRVDLYEGEDNPAIPSGGVNGGFHFGTGINENIDITFKFFSLGIFYSPDYNYTKNKDDMRTDIEVSDTSMYSLGTRVRYSLVNSNAGIPFLFKFRGINLNCSFDYMHASIRSSIQYDKTISGVSFNVQDPFSSVKEPAEFDVIGITTNSINFSSSFFTITPDIFIYADLFYIFTLYTGPSIAMNLGSMDINLKGDGNVKVLDPISVYSETAGRRIELVAADSVLGSAKFRSTNNLTPELFFYKWTAGMEINIWLLKIQLETATLLNSSLFDDVTNAKNNFTAQLGVKIEI